MNAFLALKENAEAEGEVEFPWSQFDLAIVFEDFPGRGFVVAVDDVANDRFPFEQTDGSRSPVTTDQLEAPVGSFADSQRLQQPVDLDRLGQLNSKPISRPQYKGDTRCALIKRYAEGN